MRAVFDGSFIRESREYEETNVNQQELEGILQSMKEGWIPASVYSDPRVFEREKNGIFEKAWLFIGHESEVPKSGDYITRNILDDSFIIIRGSDDVVRVFLNMCRHRGMKICRSEAGNAKRLVCPYHAWSFRNDGRINAVPFHQEAYGGEAGLKLDDISLISPPGVESFDGLIFINLGEQHGSLREYLGEYATYLAFYTKPSSAGIELIGPQRWRFKANWKISSENFAGDAYHTPHTHASIAEIGIMTAARASSRKGGATFHVGAGFGATFKLGDGNFEERLRSIGYTTPMIESRRRAWPEVIQRIVGEEGHVPSASTVFPNLSMLHLWARVDGGETPVPYTTVRLWQPVSETETEMLSWCAVDKDATPEFKEASYKAYLMSFGSTGMFEQDDTENWSAVTAMSRGILGRRAKLHSRMGLLAEGSPLNPPVEFGGPGIAHVGFNEHNQRQWLRMWCDYMDNR